MPSVNSSNKHRQRCIRPGCKCSYRTPILKSFVANHPAAFNAFQDTPGESGSKSRKLGSKLDILRVETGIVFRQTHLH
jgi:hypothetical protein